MRCTVDGLTPNRATSRHRSSRCSALAASTPGRNRLNHPPPSVIRVKTRHARGNCGRAPAEVFLEDVPMMIDEERHQARSAVLCRIGYQREPADHVAAHQVVDFAARGIRPLPGETPKIVTMIRSALTVDGYPSAAAAAANSPSRLSSSPDSAGQVEAIFFSRLADDTLCEDSLTCETLLGEFPLGFNVRDRLGLCSARCGRYGGRRFPDGRPARRIAKYR